MNDLVERMGEPATHRKSHTLSQKLMEILRRIRKGWFWCLVIILACLALAWLLYIPLSKRQTTTTKMVVMFNKEREANSQGNIAHEIVGRITGWTTTTNKYDEIAVLTSRVVVGRMLNHSGKLDSAYRESLRESGMLHSLKDSTYFANKFVEDFIRRIDVSYTQTKSNIKTSLVTVSMNGSVEECGDLMIGLVDSYNQYTYEYNCTLYDKTLRFLSQCISNLKNELDAIDNHDREFREGNKIVDFRQQTSEYLNVDRTMEDELRDINLQIQLLSIIRNYMVEMGKNYMVVPANTGIDDAQINRIVIQFNDLVMRRSNFLTSMGEDAMRVQTITNQIEDQRQALIISIDKLTQSFNIRKAKYEQDLAESDERLQKMPFKRITLDQIDRERAIKTPLYKLLQEKYTETLIAKSAEQDQARIITYPYVEEVKLFNNPQRFYLLGLILGIILSILYLCSIKLPPREMTLEEALHLCDLPCWSMFPKIEEEDRYEKAMEALLTRLRMAKAKVIAVTCSYAYEENHTLAERLKETLELQGERCSLVKWMPDSQQQLARQIDLHDDSQGYLILDCGSYHSNPEMPLISSKADATLWNVVLRVSTVKTLDFINYSLKEGLVKKGALVLTDAYVDMKNQVNFGNFDNKPLTGLAGLIASIKGTR